MADQILDSQVVNLAKAIRETETRGQRDPYKARGKSGEFGAYQYTPDTWAKDVKQFTGKDVPLEQSDKLLQNEVAYKKLKSLKDKGYNVGQIASIWNSGVPEWEGKTGVNSKGVKYDVPQYVNAVAMAYQRLKAGQTPNYENTASTVVAEDQPKKEGLLKSIFRGITAPVVTLAARPVQLAKALGGATPEEQAINLPFYGRIEAPTTKKDIVKDIGRGLETVSLGVGGGIPKGAGVMSKTAAAIARPGFRKVATEAATQAAGKTMGALIKEGAQVGLKGGAMFGAGAGLEEEATPTAAIEGAITGGIGGVALGAALPAAVGAVSKTASAIGRTRSQRVAQAVDDLEQKYLDIERGWVQTRKASEKAANVTRMKNETGTLGRRPERVLAESGIIPEHTGDTFTTKTQAAQLRSEVQPLFRANRDALREAQLSTAPVGIDEWEGRALRRARSEQNIASGTADDLEAGIRKQMAGYRKNYGNEIKLEQLDDIKSARWQRTGFSLTREDKLASDIDYIIGKSAQETIESTAAKAGATDVAQLNREIGDILEAAKFLENLDGRKVLYGRMGTHMLRLAGAIVGSKGGPLGSIAGVMGGDVLAGILRDVSIASPLKRLILRDLQRTNPDAYIRTLNWLKKQGLDRETRLLIEPPKNGGIGPNQGRPVPVFPKPKNPTDYVGSETVILPESHSQGNLPSRTREYNAQTTTAMSKPSINPSISQRASVNQTVDNLAAGMKLKGAETAYNEFKATGSVVIGEKPGMRLVLKDEGDYVKLGLDTGSLTSTDAVLPERTFATAEEAFVALKPLYQKALTSAEKKPSVFGVKNTSKTYETAKDWLYDWQNPEMLEKKLKMPSRDVIDYLSQFKPRKPIVLYRGVRDNQTLSNMGLESWTHKKSVAMNFAEGGEVVKRVVQPEEIIFDTMSMPVKLRKEFISGVDSGMTEQEVIVRKSQKSNFGSKGKKTNFGKS